MTTILIRLEIEGSDADKAASFVNDLLDEGTIQDAIEEAAIDRDLSFEISTAFVEIPDDETNARAWCEEQEEGWT